MQWPFEIRSDISDEDLALRRQALIFYGQIAHASSLAPLLIAALIRLLRRALTSSSPSPSSPSSLSETQKASGRAGPVSYQRVPGQGGRQQGESAGTWALARRKLAWWLTDELQCCGFTCGRRDEWILGLTWAAWLLTLTVLGTKRDYVHLTKRFASIAISQLPIHYLLSLKTLSPFVWAFDSSHELINRYHRLLGIIIYSLFLAHVVLFNNYFFQVSNWSESLTQPIVLLGHGLSLSFHSLAGTSLASVRRFSYRVFFILHVSVAFGVPVLVFFHAQHARIYVVEALSALILDIAARKYFSTVVAKPSGLELLPGTQHLVKISVPLPDNKAEAYRALPASHIYLSIPSSKSPVFQLLFNPFTVASVSEQKDRTCISLIAKRRSGPMTNALARLASKESPTTTTTPTTTTLQEERSKLRIAIEGPYGAVGKHFHDLLDFCPSHILLIAGGVGATFAIPLYKAFLSELPLARIQFIWAVRTLQDARWAFSDSSHDPEDSSSASSLGLDSSLGPEFLAPFDENIQLCVTENGADDDDNNNNNNNTHPPRLPPQIHRKRPPLQAIINETLGQTSQDNNNNNNNNKIAILVCGPTEMARDVTRHVRPWVMKGRDIWFHQESFGW